MVTFAKLSKRVISKDHINYGFGRTPPIPRYLYYLKQGRKSPNYHGDRLIDWKTLIRNWLSPLKVFHHFSTDQPAVILFSGGTTGSPKGVLLSNQNMNALADQVLTRVNPQPGKDSTLCILPLFHGFGLGICLHSVLLGGGRCILIPRFSKRNLLMPSPSVNQPISLAYPPTMRH